MGRIANYRVGNITKVGHRCNDVVLAKLGFKKSVRCPLLALTESISGLSTTPLKSISSRKLTDVTGWFLSVLTLCLSGRSTLRLAIDIGGQEAERNVAMLLAIAVDVLYPQGYYLRAGHPSQLCGHAVTS